MNKKYIIIVVVILAISGLFYINKPSAVADDSKFDSGVNSVSAIEFSELAEDPESFLLDVHIPEQSHIPGTDAFIPYDEISENLEKLPTDKSKPLLVYCRSGSMSKQAALELQNLGYTNVINLEGGINEYRESNIDVAITPLTYDFGEVIYGDVPTTEFTLTNFTPVELNITRVSTSCSCTSAEVENESLQPYESTIIKVSFNPAVHKDDTDLGELTRTIYIDTDNLNFEQVTAEITANVIKKGGGDK